MIKKNLRNIFFFVCCLHLLGDSLLCTLLELDACFVRHEVSTLCYSKVEGFANTTRMPLASHEWGLIVGLPTIVRVKNCVCFDHSDMNCLDTCLLVFLIGLFIDTDVKLFSFCSI